MEKLLKDLITIDSSTKIGANEAIDFCCDWLEEKGLHVKELENNGYKMLVCEVGSGDKKLVLNGHVDVVGGSDDQFIPMIDAGKLYARGSADMKAGVAALMAAMAELKDKNLNAMIQLQLVTDEEIGGHHCAAYLTDSGYLGDFAICPEPTQLGIGIQAKGVLQMDLTLQGNSAHSSRPWEGENAIVRALNVYNNILNLPFAQESSVYFDCPSINLSKITGGDVYNKVPDSCVMSLDIRFLPSQSKEMILDQIKRITDCNIDIILHGDSVNNQENDPYIQALLPIIKKHAGTADIFGQHGFADTRYFAKHGIPAIEFGPTGEHWHGDNEYVVLDSVESYKQIIVDFSINFG